jgi:hypothetical protein
MGETDLAQRVTDKVDEAIRILVGRSYVGVDELSNYLLDIRLECSSSLEPEGDDEQLQEELVALTGADSSLS